MWSAFRPLVEYDEAGRSHGFLFSPDREWPRECFEAGCELLVALRATLDVSFDTVSFQAYRDGVACCDWHYDACDEQTVLSLGASRVLQFRGTLGEHDVTLDSGDLIYQPAGFQQLWQHRIPPSPDPVGERIALVFRTGSPWG